MFGNHQRISKIFWFLFFLRKKIGSSGFLVGNFSASKPKDPMISRESVLPLRGIFCYALAMAKFKLLQDLYRFPGFVPLPRIRGFFGDPAAVRISLQRRQKKRCAAFVVRCIAVTTTSGHGESAISPVATNVSIWSSPCAGFSVHGVA